MAILEAVCYFRRLEYLPDLVGLSTISCDNS